MTRRILLRGFRPPEDGLPGLGPLERQVLDVVWRMRGASVHEARGALGGTSAYTTVMTVLDRLYKKGLLERTRRGRAFIYSAAASSDQLQSSMAMGLLGKLLGRGSEAAAPVLSSLVDTVGARDHKLLDDLDRLIQEKRRQLKRREGR